LGKTRALQLQKKTSFDYEPALLFLDTVHLTSWRCHKDYGI
jgi:hypothetical protein